MGFRVFIVIKLLFQNTKMIILKHIKLIGVKCSGACL